MTLYSILATVTPVPTIAQHSLLLFLLQVSVLLSLALLLGSLARKYKMPSVVGELGAGVLIGPSLFGFFFPDAFQWLFPSSTQQFHLLDAVGQVGVIMLVGLSGMELNLALLRRCGTTAVRISILGLIIPLGFGIGTGFLLPDALVPDNIDRLLFALFMGVALCVSAIPVIAKTLMDLKLMGHRVGQLSLAAGMMDDIVGWIILSLVAAMVTTGGIQPGALSLSLFYVALTIGFAFTVGRYLVRKVLELARRSSPDDDGPVVTAMATMVLLSAAITHAMHLEAVFGAFICGILIGSDINFKKIRLPTVLSVLAPLFFATAGLRIDLTTLGQPLVILSALAVLLVAIAGKFLGAYLGGRASRMSSRESLALGAAMNARGVIEIVIANVGVRLGVLNTEAYTIIVLVAVVTSLTAPPLLRWLLLSDSAKKAAQAEAEASQKAATLA
jgi:Kef-type K+ transport system membrane component KefB